MSENKHILSVEDDKDISFLLDFILKREGYQVTLCSDGKAAQETITSIAAPDLVLLDVMLPFVDGFELLAAIRRQPGWEKVPVIMLTARNQEKDIVRALDLGASDYIQKPFQPPELLARVRRYLK